MKTDDYSGFITVGELAEELSRFEKDYPDYNVVCCDPEDRTCCIYDMNPDADGDLRIEMEEDAQFDTFYYNVEMLLAALDGYKSHALVYMAACGHYLSFEKDADGHVFADGCNDFTDQDEVVCYGTVIGDYELPQYEEPVETSEKRISTHESSRKSRTALVLTVVMALLGLLVAWLLLKMWHWKH